MQILLLILATFWSIPGLAKSPKSGNSILDRLERKLLEQERQALSFGNSKVQQTKGPTSKFIYKGQSIPSNSPIVKDLTKLSTAIEDLEQHVEYLAGEVQSVKQKILQDVAINNNIQINVALDKKSKLAFRTIDVEIDDHKVFNQNAASGIWSPHSQIPVFSGPISPGKHAINIQARMVSINTKDIPLETGKYVFVNEVFTFEVPIGHISKKWSIEIKAPDLTTSSAKVALKEHK